MTKTKKMLVTAMVGLGVTLSAYAALTTTIEFEYYSDATYTEVVGERVRLCNGKVYTSGVQTPYYRVYRDSCF